MEKIYSLVEPEKLLHVVCKKEDIIKRREEFASEKEFLQVASMNLKENEEVKAHKHLQNIREITITQEFIVVLEGELNVCFYDLDNKLIKEVILEKGDCFTTYAGGHLIKAIKETKLYEIKNGPYNGKEKDKEAI